MNRLIGYARTDLDPRCDHCHQTMRRNEPIVWLNDGLARMTRLAEETELRTMGRRGNVYHRECYANRPRQLERSVLGPPPQDMPAPQPQGNPERALEWFPVA